MKFKAYFEQFGTVIVEAETEEAAEKAAEAAERAGEVYWYEPSVHEIEPLKAAPAE